VVFHETGGGGVEGPGLAEDITGVDHTAEVFLIETAFIARVGVDDTEGEAGEGVPKFGYVGRGVAKGCQDFAKGSVLPEKKLWESLGGETMIATMCKVGVRPLSEVCRLQRG